MVARAMNLTPDQAKRYFEARLSDQKFARAGQGYIARCPFHDDRKASLSLNFEKRVWKCHGPCNVGGGVIEFEKRYSNCDNEAASANIAEICGVPNRGLFKQAPEAAYKYRDEDGVLLSEKLRYPNKRFSQRALGPDGKWVYKLDGVRRVLYNLPELITANHIAICEGEKDADNVSALHLESYAKDTRFAATTNFDGAGKWRPEYSPYFAGKEVAIFADNDTAGKDHAQQVAASVSLYAHRVRVVELPGLAAKGDVSDYLKDHSAQDLISVIKKTPPWKSPQDKLLIDAPRFLTSASTEIEWLVNDVIQRGANGFICSLPKVGKSWLAVDLALSLALGLPWVGFDVQHATKVALITREDNPALTKWRMSHLLAGKKRTMADLQERLYVNSREQSPEFRLDRAELLSPMIAELKAVQPEFVILDVFNILHSADENDNTEMRAVMEELSRLQREAGCAVGVIHHFTKQSEGTLTQRIRGAGAIAGWAEWVIGVESVPENSRVRRMQFELKAASQPDPIAYLVRSDEAASSSVIERTEWVPRRATHRRKAAEILDFNGAVGA